MFYRTLFAVVILLGVSTSVLAQAASTPASGASAPRTGATTGSDGTSVPSSENSKVQPAAPNFGVWSVGIAALSYRHAIVNDASVQNGILRVSDSQTVQAKFILTMHWYFQNDPAQAGHANEAAHCTVNFAGACTGLHAAVALGENQGLDMIGGGVSVGFGQHTDNVQVQNHNVNIGFGRAFHVKMLGDGMVEGAALPAGETQVRFKYRDANVIYASYSWTI
jgi:hypothetical protein